MMKRTVVRFWHGFLTLAGVPWPSRQGQGSMALSLLLLTLLAAAGFAAPALAQSQPGLYWLCAPSSSTNPIAGYCPVGTAYPLPVSGAATSGGGTVFRSLTLTSTATAVKASAGTVSFLHAGNTGTSAVTCFVQLYNAAAADVTVGTTTPLWTMEVTVATQNTIPFSVPLQFSTAISAAATTTPGGSTACNPILTLTEIEYK